MRHVAVNEGLDERDLDDHGRPDLTGALVRGAWEELGCRVSPGQIVLHSIVLDVTRYQWGALGHIDLRDTATDLETLRRIRAVGEGTDGWENDALTAIDCTPDAVLQSLGTGHATWVAHGWLNLALTGIALWPRRRQDFLRLLQS